MFNQNWTFRWKLQTSLWWRMQGNSNHLTCLKVYPNWKLFEGLRAMPTFKKNNQQPVRRTKSPTTVIHYTWMNITKWKTGSIATSISSGEDLNATFFIWEWHREIFLLTTSLQCWIRNRKKAKEHHRISVKCISKVACDSNPDARGRQERKCEIKIVNTVEGAVKILTGAQ